MLNFIFVSGESLPNRVISAQELDLGFANWVYESGEPQRKFAQIAQRWTGYPSLTLRYMKENLNRALHASLPACTAIEAAYCMRCSQSEDHHEEASAFFEKRKPTFHGR
ncbi:enoyl-CoA hydratase-related protein [Variovorax sp. 770b2]|uniref:enoyl-CoA hydratase-related protein n=1 Tax=Variovorax sp. 770b2 TaxID=1566271 RepID=UPI000B83AFDE|nr:enoyl-CoA hydratase-related protein [Variovorax sp. 770b2]